MVLENYETIHLGNVRNFNSSGYSVDQMRRFILFIDKAYIMRRTVVFETGEDPVVALWDKKLASGRAAARRSATSSAQETMSPWTISRSSPSTALLAGS